MEFGLWARGKIQVWVPVIAIADGRLIEDLLPRILNSGFAGHISKPIPHRAFEDLLRRVLH